MAGSKYISYFLKYSAGISCSSENWDVMTLSGTTFISDTHEKCINCNSKTVTSIMLNTVLLNVVRGTKKRTQSYTSDLDPSVCAADIQRDWGAGPVLQDVINTVDW
jgi:hypothetical protein